MSLNISKTYFINILFSFIPISFIAGNLILNVNILILLISAAFFYRAEFFKIKIYFLDKVILVFFLYALLLGLINTYNNYLENSSQNFFIMFKTLAYLRFLILYFLIRYLIENNLFNFKLFFISSSLCSVFVCLDLIYQYMFGVDIFGYKPIISRRMSGPFGDELIAGSYLQRFFLFTFFMFPLFFRFKEKKIYLLIFTLLFFLLSFSLIISGNRMPTLLFLLIATLIFLLEKEIRKIGIPFLFIFSIIFTAAYNFNPNMKTHYNSFSEEIIWLVNSAVKNKFDARAVKKDDKFVEHYKEWYIGVETWKQNKIFGGGIKSFKINCPKWGTMKKIANCGSHPHNYYLEILSDLGLVGLTLLSIIFVNIFYKSFIKKYFTNSNLRSFHLITPFMFLFIAEIFPIKTSGSFFSTSNATFIFLVMAITVALINRQKLN